MRYVPDARKALDELKLEVANEFDENLSDEEREDKTMDKDLKNRAQNKKTKKGI